MFLANIDFFNSKDLMMKSKRSRHRSSESLLDAFSLQGPEHVTNFSYEGDRGQRMKG